MNAYEVRQAWCLLQVKLCDPCLSALKWSSPCKALYKCSALPLPVPFKIGTDVRTHKRKNEFVSGQYRTIPSPILSPKPSF